jgi:hypothetical protein
MFGIHALVRIHSLAGIMEAVISKYIKIQYLTVDGKECTELVQCIYRMRQGLYDLYAVMTEWMCFPTIRIIILVD